jgi:hypothetical protein
MLTAYQSVMATVWTRHAATLGITISGQCSDRDCTCMRTLRTLSGCHNNARKPCRSGLAESSLRVLTPSTVVQEVLRPLYQERELDASYLQALIGVHSMSVKQVGARLPTASDLLLLDCVTRQVRHGGADSVDGP